MDNLLITGEVKKYIVTFLLGDKNLSYANKILYQAPDENIQSGLIYIVPSSFFSREVYLSEASKPEVFRCKCFDLPILYGKNQLLKKNNSYICYFDIIASTFFLITKYQEYFNLTSRDQHGRFIGRESTQYLNGFLQEPIVDKYGEMLLKLLKDLGYAVEYPKCEYSAIHITHDIDEPWTNIGNFFTRCKLLTKSVLAKLLKRNVEYYTTLLNYLVHRGKDPIDTFDIFFENEKKLKEKYGSACQSYYFILACHKTDHDNDYFYANKEKTEKLVNRIVQNNSEIGIHVSYYAAKEKKLLDQEVKNFCDLLGNRPTLSRNHFLRLMEPHEMKWLIENDIKEDFSNCYADGGGFELGTCRPVYWINPLNMEMTDLLLHPMIFTESKLCHPEYMNMSKEDAVEYIKKEFEIIKKYNGEIVVLFHNTSIMSTNRYHCAFLYDEMIKYLLSEDVNVKQ